MVDITLFELGPTRSARVRWTLLEAGLDFESIQQGVDIFKSEALRRVHPLGKLPAAIINGQPLFESVAIVTAIADLVPEKELIARPGTWARNLHYQWACFALNELDPYVNSTEINSIDFIIPRSEHVPEIIPQNAAMYRKAAAALEKHLEDHDFLVEDRFSVTDIIVGYTVSWGQEQGLITEFPKIQAYLERLLAREHCTLVRH